MTMFKGEDSKQFEQQIVKTEMRFVHWLSAWVWKMLHSKNDQSVTPHKNKNQQI